MLPQTLWLISTQQSRHRILSPYARSHRPAEWLSHVMLINSVVKELHNEDNATYTVRMLYNIIATLHKLDVSLMQVNRLFSGFDVPRLYYWALIQNSQSRWQCYCSTDFLIFWLAYISHEEEIELWHGLTWHIFRWGNKLVSGCYWPCKFMVCGNVSEVTWGAIVTNTSDTQSGWNTSVML